MGKEKGKGARKAGATRNQQEILWDEGVVIIYKLDNTQVP